MKKIYIISGFLLFATVIRSQDVSSKKVDLYPNEMRVGFFQFFLNTFFLEYEHIFPNNTGLVVQGGMSLKKNSFEEIYGGEGGLQFRLYTNNMAKDIVVLKFQNAYFGPLIKYKYLEVTDMDGAYVNNIWHEGTLENTYNTFAGGVIIGFKLSMLERITLDFNIGGGIQFTQESSDDVPDYAYDIFGVAYTGVTPIANFTFGFKF
jgi:hypothetical protein